MKINFRSLALLLAGPILILSCAHDKKDVLVTSAPPQEVMAAPAAQSVVGPVHVTFRGYKQIRAAGMAHFVQADQIIHMEVMLEGMKPGPYKINLNESRLCKSAKASKGRDLGEVVADAKGKVKASFDLDKLQSQDLIGKKLIVYTSEKGKTKVAACGIPEKMEVRN